MPKLSLFLLALFTLGQFASAETLNYKNAGVKVESPKNWIVKITDKLDTLSSADKKASIQISYLTKETIEEAVEEAKALLLETYPDLDLPDFFQAKINGMKFSSSTGTATNEKGVKVTIDLSIILAKKPILIFSIILPGGEKLKKDIDIFKKSFKKL